MKHRFIALTTLTLSLNAQIITTVAGNGTAGYSGDGGQATTAELNTPEGIAFDAAGNMYFADDGNESIRKISTLGIISTVAGNGITGFSGDGGQATVAQLSSPTAITFDATGNMYISDGNNNCVRMVNTMGIISTIAGNGTGSYSGDGGPATAASLQYPSGLAIDALGNLYIADNGNSRLRKVNTIGIISTFAGNGTWSYSGDGGPATAAGLKAPSRISFDFMGNLYLADANTNTVRKINTLGIINTIAGNGTAGYGGDGGQATAAELKVSDGVCIDAIGNIYISDASNNRIRMVNTLGIINTIVGNGTAGYVGDGGQATAAELNLPVGVTLDVLGNLYFSDVDNNRIRKVTNVGQAGIEQYVNSNEQVMVYPNPANTSLTLTLSKAEGTNTLIIYDMMGNIVKQSIIYNPQSIINVADLAEGIYNISITNKEGCLNKKVIIVR